MSAPAAWHPDPTGRHEYRWWDGSQWTEHVADRGQRATDPLDAVATPSDQWVGTAVTRRRSWRDPLPADAHPITVDPSRPSELSLLDPETLAPLRYLDEADEQRLGVVRFPVAGTGHRLKHAASDSFAVGRRVALVPEPKNRFDPSAIAVRDPEKMKRVAGYVPAPKGGSSRDSQRLVHQLLQRGPVEAVVLSSERREGERGPWISMWIAATNGDFVEIDRPWDGPEFEKLKAVALEAEGKRWPETRRQLRSEVEDQRLPVDRHFALQMLAQQAYRLREVHPEALEDAAAACREQIMLAEVVGPALRQQSGTLPTHYGFKQLSIILEKQGRVDEALDIVLEARRQGWDGDWEKRSERLRKRAQKSNGT